LYFTVALPRLAKAIGALSIHQHVKFMGKINNK